MDIDIEGQTATVAHDATGARLSSTFTIPAGSTGDITVKLSPGGGGSPRVGDIMLERGSSASAYVQPRLADEDRLCRWYFERFTYANNVFVSLVAAISTTTAVGALYYAPKRVVPSVADSDPAGFGITGIGGETVTDLSFANPQTTSVKITATISPSSFTTLSTYAMTGLAATPFIDVNAEL